MIKSFYSALACAAFMLVGTFVGAQLSVTIEVNTDIYGYETYWSLTDAGDACGGASEYAAGGNTVVGCAGCAGQIASPVDGAGEYPSSTIVTEGPYMLMAGDYDFHWVDDWGDGGGFADIYVDGALQATVFGGCSATTVTLAAIVDGCTNMSACNYDATANNDDGSCILVGDACDDGDASTINDAVQADCSCAGVAATNGCTDATACNYDVNAGTDDGSCVFASGCDTCSGETDGSGTVVDNPEVGDACDDGSAFTINDTIDASCNCVGEPLVDGCTDDTACNYDAGANNDDGSCCFDNCVSITLSDSFGDGWDGATMTITDNLGNFVDVIGEEFAGGASYSETICLPDGCYLVSVGGGSFAGEHSWVIAGVNDGAGISGLDPTVDAFMYIGDPTPSCALFGCTDAGACNYDSEAGVDDGSGDYSCVGCMDPDGCDYDAAYTIDAACDYSCYGCTDDTACNYDAAATIPSNGTYGDDCCFDNCLTFDMTDSFGDGWNGNTYTITDLDGNLIATGDLDNADVVTTGGTGGGPNAGTDSLCIADGCYLLTVGGGSFTGEVGWSFNGQSGGAPITDQLITVNTIAGCTDPAADNYDPAAGCDDGTCSYCTAGQFTVIMSMTDSFGDGWNDNTYTITNLTTGALVAFGAIDFAQNGDGNSVGTDIFCLDPGCYNLEVGGGSFIGEIGWSLDIDGGANIYTGGGEEFNQGFIVGAPGCDVSGCTDAICFNYNPYATVDDGSCVCPPDNDLCDGAIAVTCGSVVTGSTALASEDILGTICSEEVTGPGVWYQLDGDGSQVTASLCNSLYDTKMLVFEGSCAALTCVGGNDDSCGLQSEFSWVSDAATDYFIYVTGFGVATGDFELAISCADCSGTTVANDECENASIQLSGVPFTGSLCCVNPEAADLCTPAFATPYGVWFVMNSGDFDTFDFVLNNIDGSEIATTIFEDLGNLGCGNLQEIACGGPVTGTVAGDISAFYNLQPNTDYYFYVYTTDPAGCGQFDFTATQSNVGCTDPLACNYDAAADLPCDGCCVYEDSVPVVASGFASTAAQAFDVDAGTETCTDVTLFMFDSFGDGWNGATYTIYDTDGVTVLATGDLDTATTGDGATNGIEVIGCLPTGTYTIVVGGGSFDGEISWDIAAGDVVLCDPLLPDNDFCVAAEDLSCGVTATGSNSTATDNAPFDADCGTPGAGVWYSFVGDGSLHNINTCGSDVDTEVSIYVSDDNTCTGVFSCAADAITGGFLTEIDDASPTDGCGFFDADDVNLDFVSTAGVTYFVYVAYNDATGGGSFEISHTCQAYTPGCTNDTACNYDAAATYDDGSCEWASCVCDAACPGTGFGFQFDMADSFGDGWNGATYTIENGATGAVVATGSLDDALVFIDADNFAGPESGQDYFCICDAGCYILTVTDGDWPAEISWSLNTADGVNTLLSGATGTFEFSIGGAVCGCTDPAACNFDSDATVDNGTCEYVTCAGCTDATSCNYDPTATYDDGSYCCYDVCVTVVMTDGGFDGWEGGLWEIYSTDGVLQASGTLEDGGFGEATACLLDAGCYYLTVSGGSSFEYGWALIGADGYTGPATGDGEVSEFYFAVGGGECATCQTAIACNYDPSGFFDDCTLCDFDCAGCTYDIADNYDPAAVIDDGSCIIDPANPCPADLDGNGEIGTPDLLQFLGFFGTSCPE